MPTFRPRYSKDEFARRAQDIFDRVIRSRLRPEDTDKYLAIEIESEDFELASKDMEAVNRLSERHPDAQIFLMRVGWPGAYRMGGGSREQGER
jgi:hypothetical protein